MYNNVGGKIKGLAKFQAWVGIIISVIAALFSFYQSSQARYASGVYILSGVAILVGGCLLSWLSNLLLYGFGELVENSAKIAENTKNKSM